jgi:Domain of unknown function (DUF5680)
MKFDEKEFLKFLIDAKRATYAAQGDDASVTPLIDGSRQLEYRSEDFLYRDIYFGMSYFIGQETVYHKNEPVWSMSYSGGVDRKYGIDNVRAIYSFLRQAMREVTHDNPFRGPKEFSEGEFVYHDRNDGDISEFHGSEEIKHGNEKVYSLRYSGGYIR